MPKSESRACNVYPLPSAAVAAKRPTLGSALKVACARNGATINETLVTDLIRRDAESFVLLPSDALPAYVSILAEIASELSADDMTTLVAIGSVLYRAAAKGLAEVTWKAGVTLSHGET